MKITLTQQPIVYLYYTYVYFMYYVVLKIEKETFCVFLMNIFFYESVYKIRQSISKTKNVREYLQYSIYILKIHF